MELFIAKNRNTYEKMKREAERKEKRKAKRLKKQIRKEAAQQTANVNSLEGDPISDFREQATD